MTQWYDDPEQIRLKLTDLAGLREVVEARREAGGERLKPLVFLGRLTSDQCGQLWANEEGLLPPEVQAAVPSVCAQDAFFKLVEEKGKPPEFGNWWRGYSSHGSYSLPTSTRRCARCGKGWDISNCWDVYEDQDFADFPLDEFVGKTLAEVEIAIADLPEAAYLLAARGDTITVRPAGVPPHESLYRHEGSMIIGPTLTEHEAWEANIREVGRDYVVQPGDVLHPFRYQSYHGACYRELMRERREQELAETIEGFKAMLEEAGFTEVSVSLAPPPQHLVEELKEEYEDEPEPVTPERIGQEMPYFAVVTAQGNLGIMVAGEGIPVLDLKTTGVSLRALRLQEAAHIQGEPSLIGFDEHVLSKLCLVMERKKK